jgi:putative ABC transport system permease protein
MATGLAGSALRGHRPAFLGTVVAALFAATVVSAATTMLSVTGAPGVSAAVGDMAVVLLIGSIYMSIFVVASTMGTAVAQQHRELALVRTVGARPRQVRRAVVVQAVTAAVPAALAGCALGALVARPWFAGMRDYGLIPSGTVLSFHWVALPVCLGVAVLTSALAALLASVRFSLPRPARALEEAAAGRRGLGWLRAVLGVLAVAGGTLLSVLLTRTESDKAGQASFLVLLLFCVGVGLLGPRIVGPAAWLVSAPVRKFGGSARLAMLNVRAQPRRFAAAVVPLVLVTGFGLTKIGMRTTAAHHSGSAGSAGEVWLDYVGTGLYAGFAAIAAANTLAMTSFERRREIALLRVVGTLPRQVRTMACWEAATVAATALVLGGLVSLATMAPMLTHAFGSPFPYLPWQVVASVGGGVLLLAVLATGVPVGAALRRRAITVVGATA